MAYPVIPDVPSNSIAPYPISAIPKTATSGDVAHTLAVATLPAAAGKTTYITGFTVGGTGATAALVVDVVVTDGTWVMTYPLGVAATSTAAQFVPLDINFAPAIPATNPNTAITVSCPSLGTGNTNICVNATGFQL